MIDFILIGIYKFLHFLIGIFPVGTGFPESFHEAMITLGSYLHILDPIVPMNTLLTCLIFVFSIDIAVFAFKVLKWIISFIPIIRSSGNSE